MQSLDIYIHLYPPVMDNITYIQGTMFLQYKIYNTNEKYIKHNINKTVTNIIVLSES